MVSRWTICLLCSSIWSSSLFSLSSSLSFLEWDSLDCPSRSSSNLISSQLLLGHQISQFFLLPGFAIPGDYPPSMQSFSLPAEIGIPTPPASEVFRSNFAFPRVLEALHHLAFLRQIFQGHLIEPFRVSDSLSCASMDSCNRTFALESASMALVRASCLAVNRWRYWACAWIIWSCDS